MRIAKFTRAIKDCTEKVFLALINHERKNHKFKYSTSVQISSEVSDILGDMNKTSRGILKKNNRFKKAINLQKQRTLR